VSTIVEDNAMELHKEMKICANKQSAVRSATEQAADLANVFKDQHAVQRMTTVENVDASNCPIKKKGCSRLPRNVQQGAKAQPHKEGCTC